ncbi:MAG TPA: bifunctional riboflavin kinase/FAD synthetase [Bryobacteraceae bacterium]|nr:bifunctional riboflavin kinase/FAD synthetase [Bryobacteraceae bacterium]
MRIYRSLAGTPADFGPSVLTIGNFDGVHLGHRRILERAVALGAERGWKPSALTFDPHPTRVVAPERTPRLLTTAERRAELMAELGIEQVLILPFTREIAELSPEQFARDIVAGKLGAKAVLVGENFHFGRRQSGNVQTLEALGRQLGFATETIPTAHCRGRTVSSSAIRDALERGQVALAARLLQHPYALDGDVVRGQGIGSKQTVPTLNLQTAAEVIPARGVYLTRTCELAPGLDRQRQWNSITNVGYRPTFGAANELTVETFLLDRLEGTPPARIRVEFLCRVRDERKFESPEALKAQILRDVRVAQNYFRRRRLWLTGRLAPA